MDNFQTYETFGLMVTTSPQPINFTDLVQPIANFTGSITGTVLTVTGTPTGSPIAFNQVLAGSGVTTGTIIRDQLSGTPGGAGTYALSASQTVASEAMTATGAGQTTDWPDARIINAGQDIIAVTANGVAAAFPTNGGASVKGLNIILPGEDAIFNRNSGNISIVSLTTNCQAFIASGKGN